MDSKTAHSIFFTVALAARGDDLLMRKVELLRQAVRITRAERPFKIDAWVVLPDHLHAIWTLPAGDDDVAVRWSLIKSRFSASLPKLTPVARRASHIWQRRFVEQPLNTAQDHAAYLRFCRNDPARHGLVEDGADWPYSSFHEDHALRLAG